MSGLPRRLVQGDKRDELRYTSNKGLILPNTSDKSLIVTTAKYRDQLVDGDEMSEERDLDLVLVTGAGASRELTNPPFPLMAEWSAALRKHLISKGMHLSEIVNLPDGASGYEFEERLGAFLRETQAFQSVGPLISRTINFPNLPSSFNGNTNINDWHYQICQFLVQAVAAIHESLVEEFGKRTYSTKKGSDAYRAVLGNMKIQQGVSKWVCANTNYDQNSEGIIYDLGFKPNFGVIEHPRGGEKIVKVTGLVQGMGSQEVPVLHLHGSVGWFQRVDGSTYATASGAVPQTFGDIPIVMLPDPDKDYQSNSTIRDTWIEFRNALTRAQKILIVGHSLHDKVLVDSLKELVEPITRVGVAIEGRASDQLPSRAGAELVKRIPDLFGRTLATFPIQFGEKLRTDVSQSIQDWVSDTEKM
jgi:hypothetical protein